MRRTFATVLVLALVATVLLTLAAGAGAHSDKRFVLTTRIQLTGDTTGSGTFAVGGAISDRGLFDVTFTAQPTRDNCFAVTADWTFAGSAGNISAHGSGPSCSSSPTDPRAIFDGRFEITHGTGAYAGLSGRGTVTGLVDFEPGTGENLFDGKAHLGR